MKYLLVAICNQVTTFTDNTVTIGDELLTLPNDSTPFKDGN
jgi:hypothetical protein